MAGEHGGGADPLAFGGMKPVGAAGMDPIFSAGGEPEVAGDAGEGLIRGHQERAFD